MGRVYYFINFWEQITFKLPWLSNVCVQLRKLYHIYHTNKYDKEKIKREQEQKAKEKAQERTAREAQLRREQERTTQIKREQRIAQKEKLKELIPQYEKEA